MQEQTNKNLTCRNLLSAHFPTSSPLAWLVLTPERTVLMSCLPGNITGLSSSLGHTSTVFLLLCHTALWSQPDDCIQAKKALQCFISDLPGRRIQDTPTVWIRSHRDYSRCLGYVYPHHHCCLNSCVRIPESYLPHCSSAVAEDCASLYMPRTRLHHIAPTGL